MACDITSGRVKQCSDTLGGVSKLYLFNYVADPFTVSAGEATAMNVLVTAAYEYDLEGDGHILDEQQVPNRDAGTRVNTQTITAILQKIDAATSAEMNLTAANTPQAVVKDRNGNYFAVGITDGVKFSIAVNTGSAHEDNNGYTLTGTSKEALLAPILDSSTVTAFLAVVA
mgnify:FL=1|tara:strand:+ start:56 stop:568 length:513 start_codon:yes stop_codon:yes gene_type:complete